MSTWKYKHHCDAVWLGGRPLPPAWHTPGPGDVLLFLHCQPLTWTSQSRPPPPLENTSTEGLPLPHRQRWGASEASLSHCIFTEPPLGPGPELGKATLDSWWRKSGKTPGVDVRRRLGSVSHWQRDGIGSQSRVERAWIGGLRRCPEVQRAELGAGWGARGGRRGSQADRGFLVGTWHSREGAGCAHGSQAGSPRDPARPPLSSPLWLSAKTWPEQTWAAAGPSWGHYDSHSISLNASLWGWCVWLSILPAGQDRDRGLGFKLGFPLSSHSWTDTLKEVGRGGEREKQLSFSVIIIIPF